MGEAKNRKQHEANFGRVPKQAEHRGLVVSPPLEIDGTQLFVKSSNLDPQELRFSLLFWDRLVWPSSRAIYFASNDDELFLESAGVLSRPDYTIYGDGAQGIANGQRLAFQDLERIEPGAWALAQGESSLLVKGGFLEDGNGALLALHRAIPVPKEDVPLAEILAFKERRRDELLLLRYQIESFVSNVEKSQDNEAELLRLIRELDHACADLLIVSREWRFPVYLSNIKASFNLTPTKFIPTVLATWSIAQPYGLAAAASAAGIFGLASTLELKGDFGLRSDNTQVKLRQSSPYRYVYNIHEELS